MTNDEIARFLRTHPKFFDQHPELLETIYVPHPYGGRAIALSERQTVALREKAKLLEGKLAEIIRFADENDAIGEKVHRLSVALAGARDFPALAHSLYFHLRADFQEAEAVSEAQRQQAEGMPAPHCGPAAGSIFAPWCREAAEHVRSLALVPLSQSAVFGLLALGSEDPQRFFPEMGTLYLRRIGELCAAGVTARL